MFFVITYVLGLTQYMKLLPCQNPFVQQPRIDPGRVFLEQCSAHFVLAKASCSSVQVTAELLSLGFATGSKHPVNGCNLSPSPFAITPFLMRAVVGWGALFLFLLSLTAKNWKPQCLPGSLSHDFPGSLTLFSPPSRIFCPWYLASQARQRRHPHIPYTIFLFSGY